MIVLEDGERCLKPSQQVQNKAVRDPALIHYRLARNRATSKGGEAPFDRAENRVSKKNQLTDAARFV